MMTEEQVSQAKDIAELEVRRYFDVFLEKLPGQIADAIKTHDKDPESHGGVERRVSKIGWALMGWAAAGGGTAAGVMKAMSLLAAK